MATETHIAIVGGGLNGLALALALVRENLSVTVIDAQPAARHAAPGFDGRAYALALASQRLLRRIGVWEAVADEAGPILEIKVSDGRAGEGAAPFWLHFDHAEIEEGPMGYMVEDRHLRPAFLEAMAAEPRIAHRPGETVVAQESGAAGAMLELASGERIEADLVVGCDGRDSGTARRAGIGRTGWGYDQTGIVCAVEHALPHHGIAHQFFMPGGPLAILPLKGNRSSIVWSEKTERAAALLAMDDAAFLDALRPAFGSFLGEIGLAGQRFGYPLGLSLAERFVAERVALVGDAAHGVHPLAGQGLNAGLRDVGALAAVLGEARQRGEDPASLAVLRRYQQWRRFDTATLAAATDGFNRLFSNDNPLLRTLRHVGLGAVNALPGLRRGFIREAAGLTGELPPLMRP
ncbi:ubiquinone biosynthesis hydroxylase, UbiH/UbiF/VisC/COQ6 family protein [Oceanicola granulosus HTCC2516]|uniref:Ubiquinone biosynthesis hydroxylase, UbiH/UbiF/VisC/COQ6 family protein n=1 Tax=Oceanicola granulosus (strain ATCC BAA-861 / DSM 15982 / KCTC 12143 / HTCC2516) TaxID=314256 RepID=Q2CAK1_OCEGH|nr:UbiH/UbiF/VisC/COQ6 family ubiquinone biosynthesis hydroxylase [Oceanicola granulosus]EAR49712.1 ubiquinone biosynthesis hydroxylase, UbiH/UbiF/VisC/COQ6 family protein [Oceanicola granulosus HTCC2516]